MFTFQKIDKAKNLPFSAPVCHCLKEEVLLSILTLLYSDLTIKLKPSWVCKVDIEKKYM